jgi:hypothetical protein
MRSVLMLVLSLAIGSCETADPNEDLKARARAGDPAAACDLVLHDLRDCSDARKEWLAQPGSPRPACMAEPLPAEHQRYFLEAIESLEGPPERKELLGIINDGVRLTAASLKLDVSTQERLDSMLDIIAQSCATLHH